MSPRPIAHAFLALAATIALAACSSPTVPDFTYYRLPRPEPLEAAPRPLFGDIVVDVFAADGLFGDQALIYATDPGAQELRQYHYQLWTDPPTRVLQRRMIEQLRKTGVAGEVTDELPASHPAIRISGVILRFDRAPNEAGGFTATVALKLRADDENGVPMLDDYYRAEKPAADATMRATVDAYGAALDQVFAAFYADLRKKGEMHAG
ncbi:MAG TPA: ABC-type transport auxiliary lipoprotein family protein [Rhodanobacteraceae bacterium]|nr:ABC-type transport auxiliary lipoprotein family protein [Rhodanobacteraceae bacterium]